MPTMSWPDTATAIRAGDPQGTVTSDTLRQFIVSRLQGAGFEGRSVLVVVPDATRTMPLPHIVAAIDEALRGRVRRWSVLVALGTHRALSEPELDRLFGVAEGEWMRRYPGVKRHNHAWWSPQTFHHLGALGRDEVRDLTGGLLDETIDVRINRLAVEHDHVLIAGPVFPHEVVGFSGGTKYLFPGISGREMIDASHWLGALIGVRDVIGAPGVTPVRALIDAAAAKLPTPTSCLAFVVADRESVHGAFFGGPLGAWAAAAELSAQTHIEHVPRPYRRVLSIVPPMYEDLWTAAKGVYKLDPVTADGGEIVLYAPHLRHVSIVHGEHIERVGYHCRDYLLAHLDRLAGVPRGVLAHSCHVRGDGSYDPATGERCRMNVTLATAIPADACHAVNLGHRDPTGIRVADWAGDPDTLIVHRAGERLYRLTSPPSRLTAPPSPLTAPPSG
jgi:nickel-dependent lactate racemase